MRVLILDDDEARHRSFRYCLIGNVDQHAYSAAECIQMLKDQTEPFDCCFLDHDLSYEHYEDLEASAGCGVGTGAEVASFIAITMPAEQRPKRIYVHSWNPYGASNMIATLKAAGATVYRWEFRANELPALK